MRNKRSIVFGIFLAAFCLTESSALLSQEVQMDAGVNPVLAKRYQEIQHNTLKIHSAVLDTLSLPFLDDFSKEDIYPDASLWLDSNVYINRDYPFSPPTLGVATFDGVSKTGCPYDTTNLNVNASDSADMLTSKPINLFLPASDSVYLSFFWQAKGRGNDPEPSDTLLLDFFNPTTGVWKNIWYRKGYNPTNTDTTFRFAMIPVTDTAFLKNAFQFRFRNYATVSGNVDHWHIDYVYLNNHRSKTDTVFNDVAFAHNSRSLLKNYYAMPWEQYQASEMKTNLSFLIRNNDTVSLGKNTSFVDTIFNSSGGIETSYSGGSQNITPYPPFCTYGPFANPPIGYSFPDPLTDTTSYLLEAVINTAPDADHWNDTLRFRQYFHNYFAYDDGTVEAGYGLNVAGGQMAYKFSLNNPDTLVALQMLFNWIPPKTSYFNFKIRVWNDAGGIPGSVIFEDTLQTPHYQYQHQNWTDFTNMFYTYNLSSKINLPAGTFYVGLIQYTTSLINLGMDKNTNSNSKMFYNVGNGWVNSVIPGSWMIRPTFRKGDLFAGVNEQTTAENTIVVYPNPSAGEFMLQDLKNEISKIKVYDIVGKQILASSAIHRQSYSIDLSSAPSGIYFLHVTDEAGKTQVKKLIVSK